MITKDNQIKKKEVYILIWIQENSTKQTKKDLQKFKPQIEDSTMISTKSYNQVKVLI